MIKIFNSKVLKIRDLTSDVKEIRLSVPSDFDFKSGQYLSMSVFDLQGRKIRRPFSIANYPKKQNKFVELCIKILSNGLASEFVKKLKLKDEVELFGPAGKFCVNDPNKDVIFIAAGVGIAPFISMIPDLLSKNFSKEIILIKSAHNESESLYDKELTKLADKYFNFKFYNIFSKPQNENSNKGYIQDFLKDYIPKNFKGDFYICGMDEMIESVKSKLISIGFDKEKIFSEKFD